MEVQKSVIGVIGAGTMGRGIAQLSAMSGFAVVLFDTSPAAAQDAIRLIAKDLQQLADKGKFASSQISSVTNSIRVVSELAELKADFIIEAVVEDLGVKQKIFSELEKSVHEETLLFSNTSSISISQIGSALKKPDRFAGLHFFNPAVRMNLVEVVKGAFTTPDTVSKASVFARALGKEPVIVQDSPGFIVNRVARLFYVEALKEVEEGVTDFGTVDKLMRNIGFRMGPFELMDLIGIDINLAVTKSIFEGFYGEPRFRPSRVQQQKVDAGTLGRKTGKGFYNYE